MRECVDCGRTLPLDAFSVADKQTGRRKRGCRACHLAKDRVRRANDAERYRAVKRAHYAATKSEYRARVKRWRLANPDAYRTIQRNAQALRRARIAGATIVEPVDYAEVFTRSGGICGICDRNCSIEDGSIDHIVPLSRGGDHSYANTQLACRSCNFSKGAKVA